MLDIEVIDRPSAAAAALEPVRSQLLSELREPASAATLATRLGLKRQKINYHLRTLEEHGLVEVADTRKWGGLTERLMVASATAYVVSTSALGPVGADPIAPRTVCRRATSLRLALGSCARSERCNAPPLMPENAWRRWRSTLRSDSAPPLIGPHSRVN